MRTPEDKLILEEFLPFRLNRLSESVSLKFAQTYKREFGMTRPEWRTLATLGQHGRLTSTQICGFSTMHKTKVSRAVQSLAKRGWLTRERDLADRRVEYLQLTQRGVRSYGKLVQMAREFELEFIRSLPTDAFDTINKALGLLESVDDVSGKEQANG